MTESPTPRIPWPRILGEGTVIVMSILLAFALDAAWDTRNERAARKAALVELRSELQESRTLLEVTLSRVDFDLQALRTMLANPEAVIQRTDPGAYGDVVEAIFRPNTADDNATGIEAVLADPRLRDLQDDRIRSATTAWQQRRSEVVERGTTIMRAETSTLELLALHPAVQRLFAGYDGAVPGEVEWKNPIDAETLRRLAESPEVRATMARKALQAQAQREQTQELYTATGVLIAEVDRVLAGR